MPRPLLHHARCSTPSAVYCATGFTLLEVMVATILITAGIGALIGTATRAVRMVVRGRQSTRAFQAAISQIEALRGRAATGPSYCGGLVDGADSSGDGTAWSWRIESAGALLEASVVVSVPLAGGRKTDTLRASLWCP